MRDKAPRPRPFDVLFGEGPSLAYSVEPPRPATTVSPPAPDALSGGVPPLLYVVESPRPVMTVSPPAPDALSAAPPPPVYVVEPPRPVTTISPQPPAVFSEGVPPPVYVVEPPHPLTTTSLSPDTLTEEGSFAVHIVEPPHPAIVASPSLQEGAAQSFPKVSEDFASARIAPAMPESEVASSDRAAQILSGANAQVRQSRSGEDGSIAALPESLGESNDETETDWTDRLYGRARYLVRRAREADLAGERTTAEFYINEARSLTAKARPSEFDQRPAGWLWLALVGVVAAGSIVVAITYSNATLFQVIIDPSLAMLLRMMGWGGIGGACGAIWTMLRGSQRGKSVRVTTLNYFARPVLGGLLGAELYLLFQVALLFANTTADEMMVVASIPLYAIIVLIGFKLEAALTFSERFFRNVFQIA